MMIKLRLASNIMNATKIIARQTPPSEPNHALFAETAERLAQNSSELQAARWRITALHAAPANQIESANRSKQIPDLSIVKHLSDKNENVRESEYHLAAEQDNLFKSVEKSYKSQNYEFKSTGKIVDQQASSPKPVNSTDPEGQQCLDPVPLFVAQNSICWYALSVGLSCYILDLIIRKRRRSKGTIQLLDVRADSEGNLIELILSNNHKRFAHWLPGQFVYLNCPQVASFEWHPFTISSMDNANRLFTLHIKTGGDWTKKLRAKLGLSSTDCYGNSGLDISKPTFRPIGQSAKNDCSITITSDVDHNETPILPDFITYNKSGEPLVKCTKLVRISYDYDQLKFDEASKQTRVSEESLYSIPVNLCNTEPSSDSFHIGPLDLYIDGPFHSPFERLLEQSVSVGIANGVGWTAFSSAFQCVTNNLNIDSNKFSKDWWKQQHQQLYHNASNISKNSDYQFERYSNKLGSTSLHLMIIVTSIEQLRPFYEMAVNYFNSINECSNRASVEVNPIREITAFITRSNKDDKTVTNFCTGENLQLSESDQIIRVSKTFSIHFGKPDFRKFLGSMRAIYADERKISVYCCGSTQVKKIVREICCDLNRTGHGNEVCHVNGPSYSYHEESF